MDNLKRTEQDVNQQRLALWTERIRECRTGGLTVKEWCRQNSVSIKTYYYWFRKIKRELVDALPEQHNYRLAHSGTPAATFTQVVTKASCEVTEIIKQESLIVDIGKCRVNVAVDTDLELLGRVIKVMVAVC